MFDKNLSNKKDVLSTEKKFNVSMIENEKNEY